MAAKKPAKKSKRSKRSAAERNEYAAARAELAAGEWTSAPSRDAHGRACIRLVVDGILTDKFCYSQEKADSLIAAKYRTTPKRKAKAVANPRRGRGHVSFRTRTGKLVRF